MQMCYSFDFLAGQRLTAAAIAAIFARLEERAPESWPCWAYSNHDMPRHITRWGISDAAAKAYMTLLMCLRGSACLYQGEELGLSEADIAYEDLRDPYGIEFWPEFKGRDGCRTPMVWQRDDAAGGFSTGKPWLPVPADHLPRAAAEAEKDGGGLLHHYRRALAFRHAHPALSKGAQADMAADGPVLSFRRAGAEDLFIAVNLSDASASVAAPGGDWAPTATELGSTAPQGARITLGPWGVSILKRG
jgi:alpha-glucosidase